ncbi:hypothetical protein [Rhizobium azibense]|uniref:hypothetical protein n=1 Tax=Rhizobium azibense TaxID=1136135 RepID=UPI001049BB76|nr:hypothetical protein [Rhizobium azibense]
MFLLVRPRRPRLGGLMLVSTISSTPLQQRASNGQAPITISAEGSASAYQKDIKTVSDEGVLSMMDLRSILPPANEIWQGSRCIQGSFRAISASFAACCFRPLDLDGNTI